MSGSAKLTGSIPSGFLAGVILSLLAAACNLPSASVTSIPPTDAMAPFSAASPILPAKEITEVFSTPSPTSKFIGMWSVLEQDLRELHGYGIDTVFFSPREPSELVSYLETAEELGMRVIVNLVRHDDMVDQACRAAEGGRNCPFDPEAFRSTLEPYEALELDRFAGTSFYAHMMMDEPFDPTNWGGKPIPDDHLRKANSYSKDLLGDTILTAINAGTIQSSLSPGLADLVTSTFYSNKERRFGTIESYLQDQAGHLVSARAAEPALSYILLLQAFGGGPVEAAFPSPSEMEAKAIYACQQPFVDGVIWWTWTKREFTDFSTVLSGPGGQEYADMIGRVAKECGS